MFFIDNKNNISKTELNRNLKYALTMNYYFNQLEI